MNGSSETTGRVALVFTLWVLVAAGGVRAEPLTVRYHDQAKYREEGLLRFVVEAQEDGSPIEGLDRAVWGLQRGDKAIEATSKVTLFRSVGEATHVLVVLAANSNFLPEAEEVGPDGQPLKRPMVYALDALDTLRTQLGSSWLSIACYNEVSREPEFLKQNGVASKLSAYSLDEVMSACRPAGEDAKGGHARLPTLLQSVVQKWLNGRKPQMLRYVIVVITDGNSDEPVQETWLRTTRNRFSGEIPGWLELYVVGLEDGGDPSNLKALARDGVLRVANAREKLPRVVADLSPLIAGNGVYDVAFTLTDRVTGASVPLVVTAKTGEAVIASAPYTLLGLERKTGWVQVVIVVLGVLVGLLMLLVIIRLIAAAVEARRRREEEAARATARYEGPSRGRLIVRDGPATGTTYHLIEDLTYIGRSPDNHISIPDGSVGKRHASIRIREKTYEIEDLQSTNGVFVNGQRVLKAHLKDGDSIRLGSTEMQFRL